MTSDAAYSSEYDDWSDGYPPDWNERKKRVKLRDNHTCQECGDKYVPENDVQLDVHHIVPKSEDGPHTFDNLLTLCRQCHAAKHPDNPKLARRADDSTSLIVVFLVWVIELFSDDDRTEDLPLEVGEVSNVSTSHDRVHITAKVERLWDPSHENMRQVGLLTDGDNKIKFSSWKNHEVKELQEGPTYRIEYASVTEYEGDPQLKLDTYTEIERI